MNENNSLDWLFQPRSIAVVGASPESSNMGTRWLGCFKEFGFPGAVYVVNPKYGEVDGKACFPSVRDIPSPVDYVISSIPAHLTPQLAQDCVAKGVKAIHFYTSGYAETGIEERARLEEQIIAIARKGGIRVIGPNCMGLYYPRGGISWQESFPKESGPVGMFSQSGGNATDLLNMAKIMGFRFSKVISYGNAQDLNESDFLEYFVQDPETRIIAAYIEGVKDGPRFLRALREAGKAKPVVVLKGGLTGAGTRAVASHTGSLAGSQAVWEALCRQYSLIPVSTLDEMAEVLLVLAYMSPSRGRRVGVVGFGGGNSVASADACERAGLVVPPLPPSLVQELLRFTPAAGTGLRNPIDTNFMIGPQGLYNTARIVSTWEGVDFIIFHLSTSWLGNRPELGPEERLVAREFGRALRESGKPGVAVIRSIQRPSHLAQLVEEYQRDFWQAGIPVYTATPFAKVAQAVARALNYWEDRVP